MLGRYLGDCQRNEKLALGGTTTSQRTSQREGIELMRVNLGEIVAQIEVIQKVSECHPQAKIHC